MLIKQKELGRIHNVEVAVADRDIQGFDIPVVWPPVANTTNETALTIRQNAFMLNKVGIKKLDHIDRVIEIKGDINNLFSGAEIKRYQKAGFCWFVTLDFIKHFKYHASIAGDCVSQHGNGNWITSYNDLQYDGDIPDFALDNIEKAKLEGIDEFSIHSNLPLPVKLRLSDPIVIGWKSYHTIWLDRDGSPTFNDDDIMMGVVVAAWDMEKELKVL